MHKAEQVRSLRAAIHKAKKEKKVVGFVPTMGNLHAGHLRLVQVAKQKADYVVVSIFVNPTQFEDHEDLSDYPSTLAEDARLLAELEVDLLFLPTQEIVYPGDMSGQTVVLVPKLGERFCGRDRPNHFDGVTKVVSRLFNMVQPDIAVFGKKDYQQLAIIRKMTKDLNLPIGIVGVETVRNEKGLALSSRNGYLTAEELHIAAKLNQILGKMAKEIKSSKKSIAEARDKATNALKRCGFEPLYVEVCRRSDLRAASARDRNLVILAAANLGKTRLIDNLEFSR